MKAVFVHMPPVPTISFSYPRGGGFALPLSWWTESGMSSFVRRSDAHRLDDTTDVRLVPIEIVQPAQRGPEVILEFGGFDRVRMINILRAIAMNESLPPLEAVERPTDGFQYLVSNGFHRFPASVAAGFALLPVVRGWEFENLTTHLPRQCRHGAVTVERDLRQGNGRNA